MKYKVIVVEVEKVIREMHYFGQILLESLEWSRKLSLKFSEP